MTFSHRLATTRKVGSRSRWRDAHRLYMAPGMHSAARGAVKVRSAWLRRLLAGAASATMSPCSTSDRTAEVLLISTADHRLAEAGGLRRQRFETSWPASDTLL